MDKIIVFGLGKVFHDNIRLIDFKDVVCICDNNSTLNSVYGCEVIRPERIKEFKFDYVVLFNKRNITEICKQLKELGVEDSRVVNWAYYFCRIKYKTRVFSFDAPNVMVYIFHDLCMDKILDIAGGLLRDTSFEFNFLKNEFDISVFWENDEQIEKSPGLYSSVCKNVSLSYDAALFVDYFINHSVNEFRLAISKIIKYCHYIFITIPYSCSSEYKEWNNIDFSEYGYVKTLNLSYSMLLVIDTNKSLELCDDIEIYTVTHRVFEPLKNPIYYPIFAGKTSDNDMRIQGDADGDDNIACYNKYINECTSLYWIWKNSKAQIIGLTHYRRYIAYTSFWDDNERNVLNPSVIRKLLKKYDMLVLPGYGDFPSSIGEHLKQTVNKKAFEVVYEGIRTIVAKKYPEYSDDFDSYFNGFYTHKCNMFVATKVLADEYCKWLFGIILEACEKFSLLMDEYDSYSCRMIGFMAERLLTLWIKHNHIRVKELQLLEM